MKKLSEVDGMNLTKEEMSIKIDSCLLCAKTKQARIPFGELRIRAKRPLELIHSDMYGPVCPKMWNRKNYIITFLNDYKLCMIYLLELESEIIDKFKEYISGVGVKWNTKVHQLRCNGGEYTSTEMKNWCKLREIVLDYTTAHTLLNGKAERLNRTLLKLELFYLRVQKNMWGEVMLTAAYLQNRSLTKAVGKTIHKTWNDRRPELKTSTNFWSYSICQENGTTKEIGT